MDILNSFCFFVVELSGVATEVEGNIREILAILDDEEKNEKDFAVSTECDKLNTYAIMYFIRIYM